MPLARAAWPRSDAAPYALVSATARRLGLFHKIKKLLGNAMMPNTLLRVLAGMALAVAASGTALASNNKAMDADIHSIELQWEHIKFDEVGSPNQFAHIDALAKFAASLTTKYPGRPSR